jgi:hypothetical protein
MLLAATADSVLCCVKGKRQGRPVFCTVRNGLIAAPFIIVLSVLITHLLR